EVASLRALYAAAVQAEATEVERLRTSYLEQLRGCVALDEALELLDAHPDSAPLGCEAARLLAVCGELARAHATLERALRQDPARGELAEVKALRSKLEKNAGREPARTPPSLWRHWRPYQGGLWREDAEGRVHGSGYGLGDYDLAGLLEVRERQLSAPYRLDVEVFLGEGKRAYGGVLFGVDRVGSGYLAYLVREERGLAKFASDAERARVEASGRPPLFLRVARLVEGNWSMVGTWLCAAADPGAEPISLRVAVLPEGLQATVGGVAERLVRLPSAVADGEVGVLSFFGGPVAYRGFRSDLE
ncbi:MAG: hypothetical protein KDD82_27065, partial [Planctomycetes bacterium]|nr:hypothetical protein [Planctomycetota bacterium]